VRRRLRLLDDGTKEKPGDLMLLHLHTATLLRQSQSKAALKKAPSSMATSPPTPSSKKTIEGPSSTPTSFISSSNPTPKPLPNSSPNSSTSRCWMKAT
jgi:hypothetical protein